MPLRDLFFWTTKTKADNEWRPRPGQSPIKSTANLPPWLRRTDTEAAVVDMAPFVAGAGAFAHLSQLNNLGWTAPMSIFRNRKTMMAMNRTVLYLTPVVFLCQATGFEYRNFIPRWCHDRERQRDELQVRQHIQAGMGIGAVIWFARLYIFRVGRRYWAPVDIVMGGALADLMLREYWKAHGYGPSIG